MHHNFHDENIPIHELKIGLPKKEVIPGIVQAILACRMRLKTECDRATEELQRNPNSAISP